MVPLVVIAGQDHLSVVPLALSTNGRGRHLGWVVTVRVPFWVVNDQTRQWQDLFTNRDDRLHFSSSLPSYA